MLSYANKYLAEHKLTGDALARFKQDLALCIAAIKAVKAVEESWRQANGIEQIEQEETVAYNEKDDAEKALLRGLKSPATRIAIARYMVSKDRLGQITPYQVRQALLAVVKPRSGKGAKR